MNIKTPAIILARKGSKGCPDKNKRVLAGHPSWRWSVLDADAAGCRPIVTTDDHDIIEGCCNIGCEVVIRPAELANDTAKVEDAVRHACTAKGIESGPVVVLYGCVPVRPKWLISSALAVLEATGADSVQSYCPVGKCHPDWCVAIDSDGGVMRKGRAGMYYPASAGTYELQAVPHRRQDLMPLWIPDGGVIVVRAERVDAWVQTQTVPGRPDIPVFTNQADLFGTKRQSVTTRPGDVIDIDTENDAEYAEHRLYIRERMYMSDFGANTYPVSSLSNRSCLKTASEEFDKSYNEWKRANQ